MDTIIINETKRVIAIGSLNLIPGSNIVSEKEVKANDAGIKLHVGRESLVIPTFEVEDDLADGLITAYSVKDAVKIIKTTYDLDTIEGYKAEELKGEARKGVIDAIKAQVKRIEDARSGEGEDK